MVSRFKESSQEEENSQDLVTQEVEKIRRQAAEKRLAGNAAKNNENFEEQKMSSPQQPAKPAQPQRAAPPAAPPKPQQPQAPSKPEKAGFKNFSTKFW